MTETEDQEESWGLHSLGKGSDNVFVELNERLSCPPCWELQIEVGHVTVGFPVGGPDEAIRIGHFIAENFGRTKSRMSDDGKHRIYSMVSEFVITDGDNHEIAICKDGELGDRFIFRMVGPQGRLHVDLHDPETSELKLAFLDLEKDILKT